MVKYKRQMNIIHFDKNVTYFCLIFSLAYDYLEKKAADLDGCPLGRS